MARIGSLDVTVRAKPGDQRVDAAAINAVTHGPGVRRDMRRRARNVQAAAKAQVGVRTGQLKASIRLEEGGNTRGAAASVAVVAGRAGMKHTGWHHEGTARHVITARGGGVLRFVSGGQVVYRKSVNHPGNRANRFLTDNVRYFAP